MSTTWKFGFIKVLTSLLLFTFFKTSVFAQFTKAPHATWILPGVTYQASQTVKLSGQFGVNQYYDLNILYLQAFIKVLRNITLNPAYLYIDHKNIPSANVVRIAEQTFMNAVIFNVSLKGVILDDRNLIWNRLREYAEDLHFYRNRLRITIPFNIKSSVAKLYFFDEASYWFNKGVWSRNRIAVGLAFDVTHWLNTDVSFVREEDVVNGSVNLLFIMATIQLCHKREAYREINDQNIH